jgi:hypothetical protein
MSAAIDVNTLLYSSDRKSPFHERAVAFLRERAAGPDLLCLAWPAGVVIGLLLAAWAGTLVEPLLFDVAARDPLVFAGVSATLLAVAAIASLVPALRANRIDPVEALRAE